MKKQLSVLIVIAILAASPIATSADVPAPGGPFDTAFRIQNLEADPASCSFKFYDSAGAEKYASGLLPLIPAGQSAYIYVPVDTTVDPGQYAGVVECDKNVAAVVNYSDADSGASYNGVSVPGLVLYAPGIYDDYYSYFSDIVVQNTRDNQAIDVKVEIFEAGNPVPVKTQTATGILANGFATFEQENLAELAKNKSYSAKITGSGDIAAVVNIYGRASAVGQLYSYNPFSGGSTSAYAPVILNGYYGYNSSLVIQNLGDVTADVKITYSTGLVKNTTIAPGAADSRYTPAEGLPTNLLTGAKVESTNGQPLVVLVNESTDKNRAASYVGFSGGANTVSAPIVMKRYYKYNTSVTCQNLGVAAATMSISYGGIAGSTVSPSVDPSGTYMFYQPADPLLASVTNWISSATVTSAQPIVCIINEDMNEAPERDQIMDMLYAYNGIGY